MEVLWSFICRNRMHSLEQVQEKIKEVPVTVTCKIAVKLDEIQMAENDGSLTNGTSRHGEKVLWKTWKKCCLTEAVSK